MDAEIEAHIYDKQVTLPPIESALVGSLISFPEEVGMNNLQLNDPCVHVCECLQLDDPYVYVYECLCCYQWILYNHYYLTAKKIM